MRCVTWLCVLVGKHEPLFGTRDVTEGKPLSLIPTFRRYYAEAASLSSSPAPPLHLRARGAQCTRGVAIGLFVCARRFVLRVIGVSMPHFSSKRVDGSWLRKNPRGLVPHFRRSQTSGYPF
jgi:hypothetical protein